jgi:hypothetical protein
MMMFEVEMRPPRPGESIIEHWRRRVQEPEVKLMLSISPLCFHRFDSPRFHWPDERAATQHLCVFHDTDDDATKYGIYGPKVLGEDGKPDVDEDDEKQWDKFAFDTRDKEVSLPARRAFNLGPFFDLDDSADCLYAFLMTLPDYAYGNNEHWVTVLPNPTNHYVERFPANHVGTWRDCCQREHYLFMTKIASNGRSFVSFADPVDECLGDLGNPLILNHPHVSELVRKGKATFWFVLWDNDKPDFTYTIRMNHSIADMKQRGEGTPTPYGMVRREEEVIYDLHDELSVHAGPRGLHRNYFRAVCPMLRGRTTVVVLNPEEDEASSESE